MRFCKTVAAVAPVIQLCLTQSVDQETTWRLHIECLRVSIKCKAASSAQTIVNPLHAPALAMYMRRTYFVRFPLWARLALGHRQQPTNATAEAGFKVLKHDEPALPFKPGTELRLDEYISSRIPTRAAQARLFLSQIKHNLKARKRQAAANLTSVETWAKPPALPLSRDQEALLERLQAVAAWRRNLPANGSLSDFCAEVSDASAGGDSDRVTLSESWLSKVINRKAWPNERVADAIAKWVASQELVRASECLPN